jgi:hypothetical protein
MKHKTITTTVKLTHWSKSRLCTLPPFLETLQSITKSEKTNTPYDLYQHPSTTPRHFNRYPEAYTTANTDLPTHDLADNNPTPLTSNPTNLLQLPTKPYPRLVSNPSPTTVSPTSTIPVPTPQHIFSHHPIPLIIPTIIRHPHHYNRQLKDSYANYDQYELVNDGSDFDNYALIVDDTWSQQARPCYH